MRTVTHEEWTKQAESLFGADPIKWRFVCPSCGNVQSPEDFKPFVPKGTSGEIAALECIGRSNGHMHVQIGSGQKPCNYTSGGFFNLNPVCVVMENRTVHVFEFDLKSQSAQVDVQEEAAPCVSK